jgi:proline iminopeptidase
MGLDDSVRSDIPEYTMSLEQHPDLFPPFDARRTGRLRVDELHTLYWEESGNAAGPALVFLHGGPGGAYGAVARRFFDPSFWRIIYFHQRGSGESTPLGEVRQNTTQHLVSDMEVLRDHLQVERWAVTGGSWGSTLGLAYAQAHPNRCTALLLNGIFLGRRIDVDWFLHSARDVFPEVWQAFVDFIPVTERPELLRAYTERIMSTDATVQNAAITAWASYEGSLATLVPNPAVLDFFLDPTIAVAYSRLNVHYFSHGCFLDESPILANMAMLRGIPGILVHGRYDLATAYRSAFELKAAWPGVELITVSNAGHSRFDPPMTIALIVAQERLKALLKLRE